MSLLWLLLNISLAFAEDANVVPTLTQRLERLENSISQLHMAEPKFQAAQSKQTFTGLGPAASKIYFQSGDTTWGLSSEFMSFAARNGRDSTGARNVNRLNVTSVSPTLAARLHRRVLFNSQVLLENGGAESSNTVTLQKGQAVVLQAYADWFSNERHDMGVRVGHQLIPFGWVNTRNESMTYFGVLKPELERELIPSTWHENGVSFWLNRAKAEIQAGIFNSLDASGFKGETFLAGGRSHGQNARAEDLMTVIRLTAKGESFQIGGSLAAGQSAQGNSAYMHGTFDLMDAHALLQMYRLEFFGQWAQGQLQDGDSISVINSTVMGTQAAGYLLQLAANVWKGRQPVSIFARHSEYDLHKQVPDGLTRDHSLSKTVSTLGLSYFPLPNWVVKADFSMKKNAVEDEEDEFNLGTGISF